MENLFLFIEKFISFFFIIFLKVFLKKLTRADPIYFPTNRSKHLKDHRTFNAVGTFMNDDNP